MAKLNYGPAKKFLYTCQYLKGKEINIKRRDGTTTTGTVVGFGAHGTVWTKIALWAKVKDNKTGKMMQVHLMELYRAIPLSKSDLKEIPGKKKVELQEISTEEETANSK